jgi:hypothetical protein
VDQTGADAATEHFFNRPILCGPNGSGCCYPKFQPTDFWIRNGVGTANQNFYQPTNQFVDRCCYPKKNYFYRPTDLWTKREPILITHRPIIPKTRGISSSVNDRLYHEHQLSPLAPYTTVHYVTSLFGLIPTRWANICGVRREWDFVLGANLLYSISWVPAWNCDFSLDTRTRFSTCSTS